MNNPNNNTANTANTNSIPEVVRVICGNNYDSRMGSHSYSMWTTGEDWEIHLADGRVFAYQRRYYDCDRASKLEAPVCFGADREESQWDKLPNSVRKALFEDLFPEGTEAEANLFVYGEEKGAELNRLNSWVDSHLVYTRELTLSLRKQLGDFSSVRRGSSYARIPGTSYRNHVYIIDETWKVTVSVCGVDSYTHTLESLDQIKAAQKAYGRRVAGLARAAGVPWEIAKFAGKIANDREAIDVLKAVKAAKGTADEDQRYELAWYLSGRYNVMEQLLGEAWEKLHCIGRGNFETLAEYLMSEE